MKANQFLGLLCIGVGIAIIVLAVGHLLLRVLIALLALSLINYGLRLRGMLPLQLLIPLMANKKRWF